MSENTPPKATPSRPWLKALFVVSLALNLLVLGLVAGANWGNKRDHGFNPRGPNKGAVRDLGYAPLVGALDRKDRREIGKHLRDHSGSFEENRARLAQEFQTMLSLLRAEPFDADALRAQMEQQSKRMLERVTLARNTLVDRLAQMSEQERLEFADRVEKSMRKLPR